MAKKKQSLEQVVTTVLSEYLDAHITIGYSIEGDLVISSASSTAMEKHAILDVMRAIVEDSSSDPLF